MKQIYYHATAFDNLGSILNEGIVPKNMEGVTYMCKAPNDCLKFMLVHRIHEVLMLKVQVDDKDVTEMFDHSYEFFQCRCFGANKTIDTKDILSYTKYSL